jgi:hypothetical protein
VVRLHAAGSNLGLTPSGLLGERGVTSGSSPRWARFCLLLSGLESRLVVLVALKARLCCLQDPARSCSECCHPLRRKRTWHLS